MATRFHPHGNGQNFLMQELEGFLSGQRPTGPVDSTVTAHLNLASLKIGGKTIVSNREVYYFSFYATFRRLGSLRIR